MRELVAMLRGLIGAAAIRSALRVAGKAGRGRQIGPGRRHLGALAAPLHPPKTANQKRYLEAVRVTS
jgi:hypothetical protein